jgi:sialidase-1
MKCKIEKYGIIDKGMGYHGWPTCALLPDGRIMVVSSANRVGHVCPFGKLVAYESGDCGESWSEPRILADGPLDDRDGGILVTRSGTILVNWFTSICWLNLIEKPEFSSWKGIAEAISLKEMRDNLGFWMIRSTDGGKTWSEKQLVPVNSPHGPCQLSDGSLLYVGKALSLSSELLGGSRHDIIPVSARSTDDGATWEVIGRIPECRRQYWEGYNELHAIEAADGTIVAHIRNHIPYGSAETWQTSSPDKGRTWSEPIRITYGFPSFLSALPDGRLLMSYGYRREPYGIRARVSDDSGKTWGDEMVISDEAKFSDMGYPSTVKLPDGRLFTIWYEKMSEEKCLLRHAHWTLQ